MADTLDLYHHITAHGGGTFSQNADGSFTIEQPESGYAVSLGKGTYASAYLGNPYSVDKVHDVFMATGAPYVGAWHEEGTDRIHLDPVVILPSLSAAVELGRALSQEAVYDFAAKSSVYLNEEAA